MDAYVLETIFLVTFLNIALSVYRFIRVSFKLKSKPAARAVVERGIIRYLAGSSGLLLLIGAGISFQSELLQFMEQKKAPEFSKYRGAILGVVAVYALGSYWIYLKGGDESISQFCESHWRKVQAKTIKKFWSGLLSFSFTITILLVMLFPDWISSGNAAQVFPDQGSYKIIFDISTASFTGWFGALMSFIFAGFGIVGLILTRSPENLAKHQKRMEPEGMPVRTFYSILTGFGLLMGTFWLYSSYSAFLELKNAYLAGNCKVITGRAWDIKQEGDVVTFKIKSQEFVYPDDDGFRLDGAKIKHPLKQWNFLRVSYCSDLDKVAKLEIREKK